MRPGLFVFTLSLAAAVPALAATDTRFVCSKIATSAQLSREAGQRAYTLRVDAINPTELSFAKAGFPNARSIEIRFNPEQCLFSELDGAKVMVCRYAPNLTGSVKIDGTVRSMQRIYIETRVQRTTYLVPEEGIYHDANTMLDFHLVDYSGAPISGSIHFHGQCDAQ